MLTGQRRAVLHNPKRQRGRRGDHVKSFSPVHMAFGQTIRYGPNSRGEAPGYGAYGLRPNERCGNVQRQNLRVGLLFAALICNP